MTKRNPEFGGFSACFAVRAETDRKGKATPPARTETIRSASMVPAVIFQPTPPARTETSNVSIMDKSMLISTHSAREDGDDIEPDNISSGTEISTHSAREDGDGTVLIGYHPTYISTHSAREDGDFNDMLNGRRLINFNPLRPRGRRPLRGFYKPSLAGFQPTPPARTETVF